jgi:hypothetical protein
MGLLSGEEERTSFLLDNIDKAKELMIDGLLIDGGHHKQWYLEEALKALGVDLTELAAELKPLDYEWEPGIAP